MFLVGSELCGDGEGSAVAKLRVQKRGASSIKQYRSISDISIHSQHYQHLQAQHPIKMKTRSVEAEEAAGEELLWMERR